MAVMMAEIDVMMAVGVSNHARGGWNNSVDGCDDSRDDNVRGCNNGGAGSCSGGDASVIMAVGYADGGGSDGEGSND